jgi:DNA-binding HxlR family transcriptional regulator
VKRTRFDRALCPIARTADLIGDGWTPLLLRNLGFGQRRFDELRRSLGVPRASLAARLVAEGIAAKRLYQRRPPRHEYRLTEKGRARFDVLAAMWRWGEDWAFPGGRAPVTLVDHASGRTVKPIVVDERTGAALELRRLGPAFRAARR